MNGNQLLIALSDIDEKYVMEAEIQTPTRRRMPWELAALAACGVLVMLLLSPWNQPEVTGDTAAAAADGESNMMMEENIQTSKTESTAAATSETLTITLEIRAWQEGGFTAVVQENLGAFQSGMVLTVEFAASVETDAQSAQSAADTAQYPAGSLVTVEVISYDLDTGTVTIASIAPAE